MVLPTKRICLVRHGETYQNFAKVVQGSDPTQGRLTEKGLRQAEMLGRYLIDRPFEMVYCSPLERAVLTMSKVLDVRRGERTLPIAFPPELKEVNLGVLHGEPHEKWQASITGDPMAFAPEGGESWLDVQRRVTEYFHRSVLAAPQENILIVAHGGVNRGIISSLIGITMGEAWLSAGEGIPQDNTCINDLEIDEAGELVRGVVNDTTHLMGEYSGATHGQLWVGGDRRWEMQAAAD
jgi:alpha-ribazole phosphatase